MDTTAATTTSTRKKILFVITKSNWGGAQKYVFDLASSLPQDRYQATVAFGGTGPLADKLSQEGIRCISIDSLKRDISIWGDMQSLFGLFRVIKDERPDIIHVNSSKVGGLGALAARMLGVPQIIFTCHGWPFNEDRGFVSLSTIRFFSWLTVMLCHVTIAVSARDLSDGKKMVWAKDKISLVHNGIREPSFRSKAEARDYISDIAKKSGADISKEDFLIGAIGELHKNKGYEYLIRAFAKLEPGNKLAIIGEGEERKSLESLIRELKLEKSIALLGFVKDAPTYLPAFDSFALTSIKEGLPYVVIEAGFAGLPTIATNVGGVKEIIDDMRSGILIQTRKPDDIAQGLRLLRNDAQKSLSFGVCLREKVSNEFSLAKMVENTIAVYESK